MLRNTWWLEYSSCALAHVNICVYQNFTGSQRSRPAILVPSLGTRLYCGVTTKSCGSQVISVVQRYYTCTFDFQCGLLHSTVHTHHNSYLRKYSVSLFINALQIPPTIQLCSAFNWLYQAVHHMRWLPSVYPLLWWWLSSVWWLRPSSFQWNGANLCQGSVENMITLISGGCWQHWHRW